MNQPIADSVEVITSSVPLWSTAPLMPLYIVVFAVHVSVWLIGSFFASVA